MSIKWLHISDVHESHKEGYHRTAMYNEIVEEVKRAQRDLNLVFVTGDLAFGGDEKEYASFRTRFFDKLKPVLPDACRIFLIPGNHDVDRAAALPPRLWMKDDAQKKAFQSVDQVGQRKRRELLLPRFAAYRAFERDVGSWGTDWLGSEQGSACEVLTVAGSRISIVGINTAWLCQDDDDWGNLTAGRTMVETALRQARAANPDLVIVLGHHPLEAMAGERPWSDGRDILRWLEQANAIYLHGHLHAAGRQRTGDAFRSTLAIQAPSAFQAGDSPIWRNGITWGEAVLAEGWLRITPLRWSNTDREYKFDSDAGRNDELT